MAKSLFTQKLRESEPAEQFCDESAHPNLPFMNPFLKTLKAIIGAYDDVMNAAHEAGVYETRHSNRIIAEHVFAPDKGTRMLTMTRQHLYSAILRAARRENVDIVTSSTVIGATPNGVLLTADGKIADYFRENFYLTTSGNFRTQTLIDAILEIGADRILFSTDWPFENVDHAANWFDQASISEGDRIKIGRTNAIKLFKLSLN